MRELNETLAPEVDEEGAPRVSEPGDAPLGDAPLDGGAAGRVSRVVRARKRPRPPLVNRGARVPLPLRVSTLQIESLPVGEVSRVHVEIVGDGLGVDVLVPVLVARGARPGPVFGLTAAVHGNELNGVRAIHDLFENLDVQSLRGTVVGVAAVNVPGLHNHQREFIDGHDLNHIFPGSPTGNVAQVYAHRVMDRIIRHFDFLIDLHTASFGRINSLYVRADMTDPACSRMAYLLRPEIIVHNPPHDLTLRGAAMAIGIPSITVEIGDPQRFQPSFIRSCRTGLRNVLADARVVPRRHVSPGPEAVLCERSYWLYTDRGGLLEVLPRATDRVEKGQVVARLRSGFGDTIAEYLAPESGIVVGKSVNPVGQTGARILHLGIVAEDTHVFVRRDEPPVSPGADGRAPPPPSER